MTVASATVGPRTIVSVIGGRTDDGMSSSMGTVCDKSVTFCTFPLSGLHSRRRSRDVSMVPVEVVDRDPPSFMARDMLQCISLAFRTGCSQSVVMHTYN